MDTTVIFKIFLFPNNKAVLYLKKKKKNVYIPICLVKIQGYKQNTCVNNNPWYSLRYQKLNTFMVICQNEDN